MRRVKRQLLRAVLGVVARPKRTLLVAALVLAGSVFLAATRLQISADQNKLFDPRVPFFRDYLNFTENFPENEAVYVVVRPLGTAVTPRPQRWTELADAIAARLAAMPKVVRSVDARVPIDKLGDQGILFDTPARVRQDVDGVRQFIPLVKTVAERNLLRSIFLGGTPLERLLAALEKAPPDNDTAKFVAVVARSLVDALTHPGDLRPGHGLPDLQALDAQDPSRLGYYYVPDQLDPARRLLLVRVYPQTNFTSLTAVSETIEAIDAAVRAAATPYPEFLVGLTGRPALDADEMRTTDQDTRRAEVLALVSVFVGLWFALRSFWLALAGEMALGVGIGWTFGWATLSVGELNLLSIVFLLALIGIGMDYLVQILMRYRVEADRRQDPRRVWVAVFRHVAAPINTACLGAAGAFAVSAVTGFRGAAQLGIVAGGGLLLCLLAGYVVLPPLLTLRPVGRKRNRPPAPAVPPPKWRWQTFALPVLWCGLLAAGAKFALRTHFNPDLIGLQAPDHDSVRLVRHLQTWSAVVLSKNLDTLRAVETAVGDAPLVQSTESILTAYDNLENLRQSAPTLPAVAWTRATPVRPAALFSLSTDATKLAKKLATSGTPAADALGQFAGIVATHDTRDRDRIAGRLTEWQSAFLAQLRDSMGAFAPKGLDVASLPPELRSHFVGLDGRFALYVYPTNDLWEQGNLDAFAKAVEERVATVAGAPAPTGIAINLYHSTAAIQQSFYRATAYAIALVAFLVLIDLRRIGLTLMAVSVLALGLPMLVVAMGLLGVDWNFANFFALPILIGAGHEYGVFLVHRYLEARGDRRRAWGRWDVSDRALLLCAYVTCASFGFFWALASHRGLRSLGLVMTLGTACIYLASLLVLRPLLKWRLAKAPHGAVRSAGANYTSVLHANGGLRRPASLNANRPRRRRR